MNPFVGFGAISPTEFVTQYWDRQPLHARAVDHPVLQLQAERLCREYCSQGMYCEGFTSYHQENISRQQGRDAVLALWSGGTAPTLEQVVEFNSVNTLIVRGAQRYFPELASFLLPWRSFFNCRLNTNIYLTRPGASSFPVHYDQHHVFSIQMDGEKDWFLWPPIVDAPHGRYQFGDVEVLGEPLPSRAERGDIVYIPLGWVHRAKTVGKLSVHMTVGVNPPRWMDLIEQAVDQAGGKYSLLRRGLPFRFSPGRGMEFFADHERHLAPILGLLMKELGERMQSILEQSRDI